MHLMIKEDILREGKKVAIFDVDGTIFRSSLVIELTDMLIDKEIFPLSARSIYVKHKEKWLDREGDYESYIDAVVKAFMGHLKGVSYKDFKEAADQTIERYQHRTYKYTRDLIKKLKKDGYYLLAISQSPKAILDSFCMKLGFDKVYGRIYELGPNDCFTGKVVDEHIIKNKAMVTKRALIKEGLTLVDSVGIGDTESDSTFLELVEHPICFNPNEKLYKQAKKKKWEVVVERKDVVYYL